jgi:hypothetical protein
MAYNNLGDFGDGGWPPNNVRIDKADFRTFVTEVVQRIRTFLIAWSDYAGQIMVVRADGTGVSPAELSESEFADFKGLSIKGAKSYPVMITSSIQLTTNTHNGNDLFVTSASPIALTIAPDGDPDVGITDDFTCRIWRRGSGAVSLTIDSSYDNQHPDLHTKISRQGLSIGIVLLGAELFIDGNTAL